MRFLPLSSLTPASPDVRFPAVFYPPVLIGEAGMARSGRPLGGRRRRLAAVATILSLLALGSQLLVIQSGAAAPTRPAAAAASVDSRVESLLRRMTLEEKVGQMDQIVLTKLRAASAPANGDCNGNNNDPLQPACLEKVLITDKTGSILAGGTDNPTNNTGRGWAEQYNTIQRHAIEHSRLHIPIIFGVDAVHGFGHPFEATLFPQSIGMGATWDTKLAEDAGAATRGQLLATGGNWNFAPVQDLARDNRWGRYYETWAEASALSAAIGGANVRGMQGGGFDAPKVAATVKHFAGYSQSINGHDRVQADFSIRYLQDTFLPSYAGGIDAGAATVMVDSGSLNGIPAHASRFLLTEELRNRLGFKGVVISDYGDVPALQSAYHVAADLTGAAAQAINAGIDVSMTPMDSAGWNRAVVAAVRQGLVSERRIDQSVRRILRLKFQLGLFDNPYVDPDKADAAVKANRDLARQAAGESITLLRNAGGALPLKTDLGKIVVTGPSAGCEATEPAKDPACQAAIANQLGGWSVSWQGAFQPLPADDHRNCCIGPATQRTSNRACWVGSVAAVTSGCHWTPTIQPVASSIASMVSSSAQAVAVSPAPSRSTAWWCLATTSIGLVPLAIVSRVPDCTVTRCRTGAPVCGSPCVSGPMPGRSGRCWCREPPKATLSACAPRQMPSRGRSRRQHARTRAISSSSRAGCTSKLASCGAAP
jgi:beta-glucosidase